MIKNLIFKKRRWWNSVLCLTILLLNGCRAADTVDTEAPQGSFRQLVVACGIDQVVTAEWFECSNTDASEFRYGIRNAVLLKTEEELRATIQKQLREAELEGRDQLKLTELADVTWNAETDTWQEAGVLWDTFENEFVPKENGLYRVEKLCVDEYGNADVAYCYVIADLEAPVFTQVEDLEVQMTNDFEEYMNFLNNGLQVEDNYLGDITYQVEVIGTENTDSEDRVKMKVDYQVTDLAGNVTEASRNVTYGTLPKTDSKGQGTGSVYGPKLTQAELEEVAAAVQGFVTNYITEGMTDAQKVRAANDFLCHTVSYADSWAYHGANTAWGALIYHEAQCSGYARAMKALCDGMGIACYYVHSSATSHQWNEVCVDGKWYIIDVTANDTAWNGAVFLVNEEQFVNFWRAQGYSEDWDRSSVPACPENFVTE